ncbi:LOW QUALITY PROTEIN: beta-1,3-N-acetylglucosaminyltransferase radical fringe [Ascaphus truei]|uniref:LOW QUALITY PROTEIN: beta-1,3-N-acetylglucosaminyltransferase radical fringe n=1 Tax=Ascaphus truei TaxID=8439 RepID=UPI003F59C438
MKVSGLGLSKTGFLLSVSFCAALLLLIPQFPSPWRQRESPQPRPLPACEHSWAALTTPHGGSRPGHSPEQGARRQDQPPPRDTLEVNDVFIAVKTTKKYHKSRLDLLMQTWISGQNSQTFIFTDWEDQELRQKAGSRMVHTNCSGVHTRQALCCKMAVEYDKFVLSAKKWFCHLDDDNYLNLRALRDLLSAFSHIRDVYVGRPSLDHPIETPDSVKGDGTVSLKFWFATGGAGFCISRGLALKMSPWAR